MIRFTCTACGLRLKVGDAYAGRPAHCTRCKQRLMVPGTVSGPAAEILPGESHFAPLEDSHPSMPIPPARDPPQSRDEVAAVQDPLEDRSEPRTRKRNKVKARTRGASYLVLAAVLLILIGTLVVLFVHFCLKSHDSEYPKRAVPLSAADERERDKAAKQDRKCAEMLAKSNKAEARDWLQEPDKKRGVFKWSKEVTLGLVNGVYKHGATKVTAVEIMTHPRYGELTAQLVVTLPDDPDRRHALLDWMAERFENHRPIPDVGQKYHLLLLD
jgi:hypothetical protein